MPKRLLDALRSRSH